MAVEEKSASRRGGVWSAVMAIFNQAMETRLTLIAAGVAFYGLLALFPGIGAIMAVAGMIADPAAIADEMSTLSRVMPQAAAEIVVGQAQSVAQADTEGLGFVAVFGLLITLYSASKGMQALMDGMNIVNNREETRSLVVTTLLKLAMTAGLILGVLLCIAIAVLVPLILGWLPLAPDAEIAVTLARWPVLLLIAALGLAVTYRVGPAGHGRSWRWILPGAGLACILWILGTLAFAIYVRMFGSYQETFGALGGVVILLMWLWLSASIVLLGSLTARILDERRRGKGGED